MYLISFVEHIYVFDFICRAHLMYKTIQGVFKEMKRTIIALWCSHVAVAALNRCVTSRLILDIAICHPERCQRAQSNTLAGWSSLISTRYTRGVWKEERQNSWNGSWRESWIHKTHRHIFISWTPTQIAEMGHLLPTSTVRSKSGCCDSRYIDIVALFFMSWPFNFSSA